MTINEYISQCNEHTHSERRRVFNDDPANICESCFRQYIKKEVMPQLLEAAGNK